jgi:hypothetical protein
MLASSQPISVPPSSVSKDAAHDFRRMTMNNLSSAATIVNDEIVGVDITINRTQRPNAALDYVILTINGMEVYLPLQDAIAVGEELVRAAGEDLEGDHGSIR